MIQVRLVTWTTLRVTHLTLSHKDCRRNIINLSFVEEKPIVKTGGPVSTYYLGSHKSGQSWGPTFTCHLGVKEKRKAKKEMWERRGGFKEEKEKEEQDEKKRKVFSEKELSVSDSKIGPWLLILFKIPLNITADWRRARLIN
ncbi:MAG: hypothetical protein DRJ06_03065 [Candidatus Aminicenantes bacterium]|nr:MAG: hypothetical protein DRJ06_03065 [Candidatus Aminicenantes bacterium]